MDKDKKQLPKNPTGGLKKRQQIDNASRSMFIWVAIAAVAVSVCVVMAQFLFQKWSYNTRVLNVKYAAADTLKKNIVNAKQLQEAVNNLVSNQDLASVKTNTDDPNTQSVLDALPSKFDPTALGTSLQQAILSRSGVAIEGITVPSDEGGTSTTTTDGGSVPETDATPKEMKFEITVSGSYDKIRNMMLDLERTIRPMKVTSITLNGDDSAMTAAIAGVTYYQPSKSAQIKQEVVK